MKSWFWICIEGYVCFVGGLILGAWIISRILIIIEKWRNKK